LIDDDLGLLAHLDAGVAVADADDVIVRWNDRAEQLTGLAAANAVGRRWTDFIELIGGDPAGGGLINASDLGPEGWHGCGRIRVDDRVVQVRGHVFRWRTGGADDRPGLAGIFWEAHDEAPAADAGGFGDLLLRSSEPLLLIDGTGQIIAANEATAALLGRGPEDLVGSRLRDLAIEWSEVDRTAAWKEILDAGSIFRTLEIRRTGSSEEPRQTALVEVIATLIPGSRGNRVLMRLRDVTMSLDREQMLRDLAALARVGAEPADLNRVCAEASDVLTRIWGADAGLLALFDGDAATWCSGDAADRFLLDVVSAPDESLPLIRRLREAERPFHLDADEIAAAGLSGSGGAPCYATIWAAPLWFADRRIGFFTLGWRGRAPDRLNGDRL
jgi:PAS domain-containing protein